MVNLKFLLSVQYKQCCCKWNNQQQSSQRPPLSHKNQQPDQQQDQKSLTIQIQKQQIDVNLLPKLVLTVLQSQSLHPNQTFQINAQGLQNTQQGLQIGTVYIGRHPTWNDIVVNDTQKIGNRHCLIRFKNPQYYLQDLFQGDGTFMKVQQQLQLNSGDVVYFGQNMLLVSFPSDSPGQIQLKFMQGSKTDQIFTYEPEDEIISIGRMAQCRLLVQDNSLSRFHLRFLYKHPLKWLVSDGDGFKPSMNGTWLLTHRPFELKTSSVFKIGQTSFKVTIKD